MKQSFESLAHRLLTLPRCSGTLLVGVDGPGGSGKTTFARALARVARNVTVVHMDDFYLSPAERAQGRAEELPWGADFDWERLRAHVLMPLYRGESGWFRRYDWDEDAYGEWRSVPAGGVVVVEGVYSTRSELTGLYDFLVWVDCPPSLRLARGLARDGEDARERWQGEWMPAEDRYAQQDGPADRADLRVNGAAPGVDPACEFALAVDPREAALATAGLEGDADESPSCGGRQ